MIAACIGQGAALRRYQSSSSVVLSLEGKQDNGTFVEGAGRTLSIVGTPTASRDNSRFRQGPPAFYCNTSNHVLITDVAAIYTGTSDFTVEFWFKRTGGVANGCELFGMRPFIDGTHDYYNNSISLRYSYGGSGVNVISPQGIVNNVWHHVAWVRSAGGGGWSKLYVDGILADSETGDLWPYSATYPTTSFAIGDTSGTGNAGAYSYFQDFKITLGVIKYTTNFTPPTRRY